MLTTSDHILLTFTYALRKANNKHNSSLEKRINLIRCLCRFIYEQYFLLTNKSNLAGLVKHREQPVTDITKDVQSTIRLYADDCIVYRPIKSIEDCNILQDDLKVLGDWSKMWLLDFNIAKCKIMKMTKKRNPN